MTLATGGSCPRQLALLIAIIVDTAASAATALPAGLSVNLSAPTTTLAAASSEATGPPSADPVVGAFDSLSTLPGSTSGIAREELPRLTTPLGPPEGIWPLVTSSPAKEGLPPLYSPLPVGPPAAPVPFGSGASPSSLPPSGPVGPSSPIGGKASDSTEATSARTHGDPVVVEVRIVGNQRIATERILGQIRTRAGRPFDARIIEEDVRRLNQTRWFATVRVYWQPVPEGRIVIYEVVERPLIQYVKVVGNEWYPKKKILEEAGIRAGDGFDPFLVEEARRKIEDFYRQRGFSKVRVTIVEGTEPDDPGVVFLISEGPRQRVLWTDFVGNTISSDARLRTKVQTKPGWFWLWGRYFSPQQLDRDEIQLTDYYRSLGFFRARIGEPLVEFNDDRTWATVRFVVDEGPRYVVREVRFRGNTLFDENELREALELQPGKYFNQGQMEADVKTLQEKYGSIGYVFADIRAEPRFLEEPGQLDLVYNIQEGVRCRVGRIDVAIKDQHNSLTHTQWSTVLNRISLAPGDIVDIRELRASERRLRASGLFEVDATKGIAPKIVVVPPDPEQVEAILARRRQGEVRGQNNEHGSPCNLLPALLRVLPLPARWISGQAAENELPGLGDCGEEPAVFRPSNPDCFVVLRLEGRLAPEIAGPGSGQPEETNPGIIQQAGEKEDAPNPRSGGPHKGRDEAGSAKGELSGGVSHDGGTALFRGQYTPEGGVSLWPLRPIRPYGSRYGVLVNESAAGHPSAGAAGGSAPAPGGGQLAGQTPAGLTTPGSSGASTTGGGRDQNGSPLVPAYSPSAGDVYFHQKSGSSPQVMSRGVVVGAGSSTATASAGSPNSMASPGGPGLSQGNVAGEAPSPAGIDPGGSGVPPNPGIAPVPTPPPHVAPDVLPPLRGEPPDTEPTLPVPLQPEVYEGRTGRIMLSAGINSDAGLIGSIIIDEQNFDWRRWPRSWEDIRNGTAWRGAGQRFRLEAVPGTEVQRYMATFQEPYLFDTNVSLGLSGFFYNRRYEEWDEDRLGGRVAFGYQFTHDLSGTFAVRAAEIEIYDPAVAPGLVPELDEVLGSNTLVGLGVTLTHDTRDSAFLPTEGHYYEMSFEQVLGSFDYPRAEVEFRRYFLLRQHPDGSGRHVLGLSTRLAYTGNNTPIYEHYFAGGYSTLRGFEFRGASPRDPVTGLRVGGHFMLLASAEYMFPLTADDLLRVVIFCDTGTVQPDIDDWTQKYRVAPGFGLRITIPALGPAPVALDFAFPVSKERGDDEQVFSFFLGFFR
ncbi:MAG: BamA/TamA family outer membrane protein [Thermoguttaceae bacterium]|nr:BamA/TamA family outer membrane protein [Thermoguttaceae bacterium]MDW8078705.1 POTRA domain-containing protein [Thermoguttaceae bacterium]